MNDYAISETRRPMSFRELLRWEYKIFEDQRKKQKKPNVASTQILKRSYNVNLMSYSVMTTIDQIIYNKVFLGICSKFICSDAFFMLKKRGNYPVVIMPFQKIDKRAF